MNYTANSLDFIAISQNHDSVFAFACYHDWKTLGFVVKHLLGEDVPKIQGFFLTYEVCIKHRGALYIII